MSARTCPPSAACGVDFSARSCFSGRVGKGDETRLAVLDQAVEVARRVGLSGLTIGSLAEQAQLSKSGLFGHFRSKEALQLQVLEHARAGFEEAVARPALRAPRGEPRVRELLDRWLQWDALPGGCPFVAAATEFDDQPGAVRDRLVRDQRDLFDMIATIFRTGIAEGHFRVDADPEQFAQDFYGVILACHHAIRLLGDDRSEIRARRAFEALLAEARSTPSH
jgi:AcrR family transcriptional regulator